MQIDELNRVIDEMAAGEVLVLPGIPDYIYHATTGYGSTAMLAATQSMAHFKTYLESDRSPTPDMQIGSAIHTMVLEPDAFFDRFVLQPENLTPGNNNAWKAWKAEQTLPVLSLAEMKVISATAESVIDRALPYFSEGQAELSYWLKDPSGIVLKARVDYKKGDLGVDLKSTKAETPRKFLNTIKYDYHIQDALYRRVTGLADFIFIGACKQAPHAIYAGRQSAALRAYADKAIDEAIRAIQIAESFNDYPLPPIQILETE